MKYFFLLFTKTTKISLEKNLDMILESRNYSRLASQFLISTITLNILCWVLKICRIPVKQVSFCGDEWGVFSNVPTRQRTTHSCLHCFLGLNFCFAIGVSLENWLGCHFFDAVLSSSLSWFQFASQFWLKCRMFQNRMYIWNNSYVIFSGLLPWVSLLALLPFLLSPLFMHLTINLQWAWVYLYLWHLNYWPVFSFCFSSSTIR